MMNFAEGWGEVLGGGNLMRNDFDSSENYYLLGEWTFGGGNKNLVVGRGESTQGGGEIFFLVGGGGMSKFLASGGDPPIPPVGKALLRWTLGLLPLIFLIISIMLSQNFPEFSTIFMNNILIIDYMTASLVFFCIEDFQPNIPVDTP